MSDNILGQVCSLLAAITWAIALVMFKRCGERIPPLAMNLFKNVVGLFFFGLTLFFIGDKKEYLPDLPIEDTFILIISGFLGIALADTLLFECLNRIGVGLYVVIDCCYSPLVVLVSWVMIAERLGPAHYIGGALILVGIFISSGHPPIYPV